MRNLPLGRKTMRALVAGSAALFAATATMGAAEATPRTSYRDAKVELRGGNVNALSSCLNYARSTARHHRKPNRYYAARCQGIARADGGRVTLNNANLTIDQYGSGRGGAHNNARVSLIGGDVNAVASCLNYLQGTASRKQTQDCSSKAIATGGNVTLNGSDITILS